MPHFDSTHAVQHVTYHLADSLPFAVLLRWEEELRTAPALWRKAERLRRIEDWIDAGHGCCLLRDPVAGRVVQDAFLHFDLVRYRLLAWVVMPNHVHVLFQPVNGWTLARIVASWKTYTGRLLALLGRQTPASSHARCVWQREYWDRFMRDELHFQVTKIYIHDNPVKAGLVVRAEDWEWSSARMEDRGVALTEEEEERRRRAGLEPGAPS